MGYLVSIIVPVFNMGESLEESVRSLVNQDYKNIEIILVDDGSTDNSWEVCQQLSKFDDRIIVIHTENQGSGPARNVGIENSKGKYLYFPDADDILDSHAISVLVAATEEGLYDLIVFGFQGVTRSGELIYKKEYHSFVNTGNKIRNDYSDYFGMTTTYGIQGAPWNKFFSGDTIRNNGVSFPPLRRHQDEGFISRYMCYANHVKFIPEVLYTYFPNTSSLEWKKYPIHYEDCVIGLNRIWNETVVKWNSNDEKTHSMVKAEYLTKILKSIELTYSPKAQLSFFSRPSSVKTICQKTDIKELPFSIAGSIYQKTALFFAKIHFYLLLSWFTYLSVIKVKIRQGK